MIKIGEDCNLDVQKLIATRMLVNANSGGGKSYLLRRFLEQSNGQVQQIILDLEGEFVSLREEYDYLLIGDEGDIPISIRTAEILARKLMEIKVSAVIDLSDLKHAERITFVKRFLDSLMNLPKKLWNPLIVVVDEAHMFAPESKSGKAESCSAVIDLMTRGRKRGYCGILATQRIAKLNKDAMAECNNYMIGRTGLDIDMKRAGDILGFTSKLQVAELRTLGAGEFYTYGSAFEHDGIRKIKVGEVKTTHPDRTRGIILKESAPVPENIKQILKDIIDLPREAEEEIRTTDDMKKKIRELKTKLTILERSKPKPEIDKRAMEIAIQKAEARASTNALESTIQRENQYKKIIQSLEKKISDIGRVLGQEVKQIQIEIPKEKQVPILPLKKINNNFNNEVPINEDFNDGEYNLGLCEKKLYSLLYQYSERSFSKQQIGVFTGYSYKSGGFNNAISRLRQLGLIQGSGNNLQAKDIKSELAQDYDFSKEAIIGKLNKCEGEIYSVLLDNPYEEFSKEILAGSTQTGYSFASGGFNNAISRLNTLGLIQRSNGMIQLNQELLEI